MTKRESNGPTRWQVFDKANNTYNYALTERKLRDEKVRDLSSTDDYDSTWDCQDNSLSDLFRI